MIVWHVTTLKKLDRYINTGVILPPVRAWINIVDAGNFSTQTGRLVILRLKFNKEDINVLEGHRGKAVYISQPYLIKENFGNRWKY